MKRISLTPSRKNISFSYTLCITRRIMKKRSKRKKEKISSRDVEVRDINEFLKRAILRKRPHRDALKTVDVCVSA